MFEILESHKSWSHRWWIHYDALQQMKMDIIGYVDNKNEIVCVYVCKGSFTIRSTDAVSFPIKFQLIHSSPWIKCAKIKSERERGASMKEIIIHHHRSGVWSCCEVEQHLILSVRETRALLAKQQVEFFFILLFFFYILRRTSSPVRVSNLCWCKWNKLWVENRECESMEWPAIEDMKEKETENVEEKKYKMNSSEKW